MAVKIENYEVTADTFTFPYNPQSFDDTLDSNKTITNIGYQKHHIVVTGGGVNPTSLILNGHFSGTDRWVHYRNLSKHFGGVHLKKLFFEDDKFYLGMANQVKKTHTGGRTNFIDYVFSYTAIIGMLFSNTLKTSGTNAGNTDTYVFEITGTIANGSNNVVLEDAFGNEIVINSTAFATGNTFKYTLVTMINSGSGIFVSEYGVVSIDSGSGFVQTRQVSAASGFGLLKIASGANVTTATTTNLNSVVRSFRDGYTD